LPLTYAAASSDQSQASLTVRENYGDQRITIPASGWAYTDSTLTAVQLLPAGTNFGGHGTYSPTALYEFSYIAKDPKIVGLGFAAIRDLASFLRDAKTDAQGVANPLAGTSNTFTRSAARSPAARPAISCYLASTMPMFPPVQVCTNGGIPVCGTTSG